MKKHAAVKMSKGAFTPYVPTEKEIKDKYERDYGFRKAKRCASPLDTWEHEYVRQHEPQSSNAYKIAMGAPHKFKAARMKMSYGDKAKPGHRIGKR